MYFLSDKIKFPPIETANEYGILAIGGDLSPKRLLHAYKNGIFPWYSEGEPIVWYSPNPRMVLFPNDLKISKSSRKILKKDVFKVTFNQAFKEVISNCKSINRTSQGESGTWITDEMEDAYLKLYEMGIAKSIEVWQRIDAFSVDFDSAQPLSFDSNLPSTTKINNPNYKLAGGLYGVEIGNVFCGESMFSKVSNASKVAFIHLAQSKKYKLIDCQIYNDHLASLGAVEISRDEFMGYL